MQETDEFLTNKDGSRAVIESLYYRGERKVWSSRTQSESWPVDGMAITDHGNFYLINDIFNIFKG